MATRHNLCQNPALANNNSGWGGASTPARVSVSGFGRSTAAEYTAGSYGATAATSTGAVTVGATYTLSVYVRTVSSQVNSGTLFIEWLNAGGSGFGYPSANYTLSTQVLTRLSITATAPANAVACRLIVDGINFPINTTHISMVLTEETATLDTYFDGDTAGATWDGTPGNSASTFVDSATITATGTAGAIRLRPGSATITAAQAAPVSAAAGTVRLRAGAGQVTAVQNASPAGSSGRIVTRAGSGAATAAAAVALTGAAGSIRLRAAQPLITAVQQQTLTGRAVSIRVRAGRGQVAARTPSAGDIAIRLGATRRGWAARSSRR
ncbi:hypothetical protein [Streptosporangium sp. NPDC051022]|uniref:hypothetical protein n=1 Tax=Streptosporangium sp. NPDC051022 TaxID=3155752 RepID=UPI00343EA1B4